MKHRHIPLSTLCDIANGIVTHDAHMTHLNNCKSCQNDLSWLSTLVSLGKTEALYDPPAETVRNAVELQRRWKLKKPA
jgi:hypothetical protein